MSTRSEREIAHGKKLASEGAEDIWGWGTEAGSRRAKRRAELIAEKGHLHPGAHVLEVGCGTGMFTEMLARSGASIIAVDISEDLLVAARQRGLPEDRVRFINKRFEDCEVDGPFDAVVGSSILHHLEIETSLRKIYALLKPGGHFAFAEPNMLNPQILVQKNVPWIKERMGDSPDETAFVRWPFASLLRRCGFTDIEITPFDWLHPATPDALIPVVQRLGASLERLPLLREFAGSLIIHAARPSQS